MILARSSQRRIPLYEHARINWQDQFAQELRLLALPTRQQATHGGPHGSGALRDVVRGRAASWLGTAPKTAYFPRHRDNPLCRFFKEADGSQLDTFTRDTYFEPANEITFMCEFALQTDASGVVITQGTYASLLTKVNSTGAAAPSYRLLVNPNNKGYTYIDCWLRTGGVGYAASGGATVGFNTSGLYDLTKPNIIGGTYRAGGDGLKLYLNGDLLATNATPTGSVEYQASGPLNIGGAAINSNQSFSHILWSGVWGRAFSPSEMKHFARRPSRIFMPPEESSIFLPGVSGAPVVSPAGNGFFLTF